MTPATTPREPLAIVGIGCRFPEADGPAAYWKMLCESRDVIRPVPPDRWDREAFFDPDPTARGKMVTRTGGFLHDIEGFDWRAFRVSPREAKFMDPQHRLLLEVAWEAMEDAGMPLERVAGTRTAVFVGIMWNDYGKLQALDLDSLDGYSAAGNAFAFAANRISFFFDLRGPSVALDVSCASSLMAIHLAAESIWSGESEMGIAGGVNLIISPDSVIAMSKAGILSAEGHCRPFDASADGFVRGEGAGLVVLKRLSAAIADGDRVYATLRGSAAMHSGRTDWIMAPSRAAQEQVFRAAYLRAGVDPRDVDYVELHGTGTRKGDPIEASSVGNVLGAGSGRAGRCIVGSVKTNIGHLDSAAGVAGLIKAALALQHRQIPGSLHLKHVNPEIDLDALGLEFRSELGPWPEKLGAAIAGVTGLSFGGGNVHVVLSEAPPVPRAVEHRDATRAWILPLSARSDASLRELAERYRTLLSSADATLEEVCAAAAVRRSHHTSRTAVVGRTAGELTEGLDAFLRAKPDSTTAPPTGTSRGRAALVLSGQGPQWWGMGRDLLAREPVFRKAVEECDRAIGRFADFSVLEELAKDEEHSRVRETRVAQPLLFALQVGIAELLRSWGFTPDALVGHSVGEIAAAHLGGALSLADAARVVACRGRIMDAASGLGGMVQVSLSRDEVAAIVAPFGTRLSVAADNGPRQVVVSGETAAIEELGRALKGKGVVVRPLSVAYAFHSSVMDAFQGELVEALRGIDVREPELPIASTLLGRVIHGTEAFSPEYWARQMREAVEFRSAILALSKTGIGTFVEVGPHPVLGSAIAETLGNKKSARCAVPTLVRGEPERTQLLSTLAALYGRGHDIEWARLFGGPRPFVALPSYPFQREALWIDRGPMRPAEATARDARTGERAQSASSHPLVDVTTALASPRGAHVFETILDVETSSYLGDHRLGGRVVVPASLYVEMAIAAAAQASLASRCLITGMDLLHALVLSEGTSVRLQLLAPPGESGRTLLEFFSRAERDPDASWQRHVRATLEEDDVESIADAPATPSDGAGAALAAESMYAAFRRSGEEYGPAFQGVTRLFRLDDSEVLAEVDARAKIAGEADRYFFHPAMLDACMHTMAAARSHEGDGGFMPTRIDRIRVLGLGTGHLWARARLTGIADARGAERADITVFDERRKAVLDIRGISLQFLDALSASVTDRPDCYGVEWRTAPPAHGDSTDAAAPALPWLVVGSRGPFGDSLVEALSASVPVTVFLREEDPREGLAAALTRLLSTTPRGYGGVVFAPRLDGAPRATTALSSDAALEDSRDLIALVQLLSTSPAAGGSRLFVLTRDAQCVADEDVAPEQSALWGLGRSIAAESPGLWGGLVDVDGATSPADVASRLLRWSASSNGEDQLVLRGDVALVPRLTPLDPGPDLEPIHLEANASYLVTGGFGALGKAFAAWLLRKGAKHVVLLSRTEPTAGHAETIARLQALGGTVHHVVADVGDEARVRAALEDLARRGVPAVAGVLHAAGTVALKPVSDLREDDLRAMYGSKVRGTEVLDRIFSARDLAFFVLFSSASSLLPSPSLAAYAAANAFMDGIARARRARGLTALTVNWGAWAGEGMAHETGAGRGPLSLRGMGAIRPERGLRLLDTFLARGLPQAAVLAVDWSLFRAAYPTFGRSRFLSELPEGTPPSAQAAVSAASPEFVATDGEDRRERLEQYLIERAAQALQARPETLDAESTLIELGLDSLMLVELRLDIERALGVRLRLVDLLSDPSIRELSSSLEARIQEAP